jgi:hypothetical protein
METMDNVLVSFHGRGKLKQGTLNHDLPYSPIIPNHHVLAPHQVDECLPQPDVPIGVESLLAGGLSSPQEAPQEEESELT